MADEVTVSFGANVAGLVAGVDRVKEKLNELHESTEQIVEGAKGILEAFGVAFTAEKLIEFVKSMAELGEQTERTAAILGITSREVGELNYISVLTGGNTHQMAMAMEILAVNLQHAAKTGAGPAAEAFKAMNLSAKELIALPLPEVIGKIADKFHGWADGMTKTALARTTMGRIGAEMIPELDKGSESLKRMAAEADNTGTVLSQKMTERLVEMSSSLGRLGTAFTALGASIANQLAPSISHFNDAISQMVSDITIAINTGNFWERILLNVKYLWDALTQSVMVHLSALKALVSFDFEGMTAAWEKGLNEARALDQQYLRELGNTVLRQKMEWQKMLGEHGDEGKKPPAPSFGKPDVSGDAARIEGQIKLLEQQTAQYKVILDTQVKNYQMTEDQKFALLIARTNKDYELEAQLAQKKRDLYERGTKDWEQANAKLNEVEQKHVLDMLKLNEESTQAMKANFDLVANSITSSFNSQIKGLLAGTTTWASAFKTILGDLGIKFFEMIEKMVVNWVTGQLAMKIASQDANAVLIAQANATNAATLPAALAKIQQYVGEVFAGAAAFFAPTLGPGAPAAAAGVSSSVQAIASGMAVAGAAEQGAWNIPATSPWLLHKGETVLPQPAAQAFRDMAQGGGGGSQINIQAWDGASVQSWLVRGGAAQMSRATGNYMGANASSHG